MYNKINKYVENSFQKTLSGREIEARALTKASDKLSDVMISGKPERILEDALSFNGRVWNVFQEDIVSGNSPLPENVKLNILTIILFIDKRTLEFLASRDISKLKILIDINNGIASALLS